MPGWPVSRLDPSVAAVRLAVRAVLPSADVEPLALVACSGGADSLALAKATAFVAARQGWRAGLVTVDHQLQEGSAKRAAAVVEWARSEGFEVADAVTVDVGTGGGPEAAARQARYEALTQAAHARHAAVVLLGHTEDDQAETVLLALARGAGPHGLSGMPSRSARDGAQFARPLLTISRRTCRQACVAEGLSPWEDPHNFDPAFARARVRSTVMPTLADALGSDVVPNLARTAALVGADSRYLDGLAAKALRECVADGGLSVAALADLPAPIRTRVLHTWALGLGAPGAALSHRHVAALDSLVTSWHGQGPTMLPGAISVHRASGTLLASMDRPSYEDGEADRSDL